MKKAETAENSVFTDSNGDRMVIVPWLGGIIDGRIRNAVRIVVGDNESVRHDGTIVGDNGWDILLPRDGFIAAILEAFPELVHTESETIGL